MGDCCSCAGVTIPPTVGVIIYLSIISLRYDSVNNSIPCVFETNQAENVSVSWTKSGATIQETDPFFFKTQKKTGTSDTYTYTATLNARSSSRQSFEGTFECIATYDGHKTKQRTITLSAPSAPVNLRVINSNATSVTIAWDSPWIDDSNGNIISAYRVTYGTVSRNVPVTERRYIANSLHPNTLYQFAVFATTVVEGDPATLEVTTQEAAPSAPINLRVFNTSSTSLRVEWSPPVTPNGIIRGYLITYYKTESSYTTPVMMIQDVAGNVISYELTDLEIFTTYSITIQGRTIILGEASAIVNGTTEEDTPSPPTVVRAFNTSSTSLRVEWSLPEMPNGIIRGYQITYYKTASNADTPLVMNQDVASNETSFELVGLEIFTTYSIYIQARTIGLGNASAIVNATTAEDAPSPPTIIQAFNTSSTSLRVEWIPPASPNGIIRSYQITYYKMASTDNLIVVMNQDVASNETSFELVGLEIFTTYSIYIQARTIGLGNASITVNVTTEEDAPSPPIVLRVFNTSSTSLRVEWSPPEIPNGIIRGYMITYFPITFIEGQLNMMTQDVAGNETWIELTDLEIYTTYSIFIQGQTILTGEASTTVNATTDEDVPTAPINVTAIALNSTSIQISWSQPVSPNGELVQYTLYYRLKQSTIQEWQTVIVPLSDATTMSFSIYMYDLTGLLEYEQYQIAVTASTRIGEGVASLPIIVITDPDSSDPVDSKCTVRIPSSDVEECASETNELPAANCGHFCLVIIWSGVILACVLFTVVTSVIMAIIFLKRRTHRHSQDLQEQTSPEDCDQHSLDNAPSLPENINTNEKELNTVPIKNDVKIEDLDALDYEAKVDNY